MDRALLEYYLDQGLSLPQIGVLVGRDPSTVGYWVQKHGLVANGRDRYAPRGGLTRGQLEPLVEQRLSQREIAGRLSVSISTVRHWLTKYGLKTNPMSRRRKRAQEAIRAGLTRFEADCPQHGWTQFLIFKGGRSRCAQCNAAGVVNRRRKVKRVLVEEHGGMCQLCGYDRFLGALQFHHLDLTKKEFVVSRQGVTRSLAEAREEAAKCALLCANCHAEVEAGFTELGSQGSEVLPAAIRPPLTP